MRRTLRVGLFGAALFALVATAGASPFLPGDANHDGSVDDLDASILCGHWLQPGGWGEGDFSGDGVVDDRDAAIFAAHWRRSTTPPQEDTPQPSHNPEASTLAVWTILGLAGVLLARRQRRATI